MEMSVTDLHNDKSELLWKDASYGIIYVSYDVFSGLVFSESNQFSNIYCMTEKVFMRII